MFAELILALLPGTDKLHTAAAILDSWTSRFERCEVEYVIDPKARGHYTESYFGKTRIHLRVFDGYAELINATKGSRQAIVTPSTAFTKLSVGAAGLQTNYGTAWRRYGGSLMGKEVDRQRKLATGDLRCFGGLPAGTEGFSETFKAAGKTAYSEQNGRC